MSNINLSFKNLLINKFSLISILLFTSILSAQVYFDKNDVSVLGSSVKATGLGGVLYGIGELDETLVDNIPLSGDLLRNKLSLGASIYDLSYHDLNINSFIPTSYGVFFAGYSHFIDAIDENYFFYFSGGFAKEIIENLFFGFKVNFDYYYLDLANISNTISITGDIGIAYSFQTDVTSDFFVFRNFTLAAGLRNVGFIPTIGIERDNTSNSYSLGQMEFFRIGGGFDFIHLQLTDKEDYWDSRFMLDLAAIFPPIRESINVGWKNTFSFAETPSKTFFKSFYFSLGYFHNPNLSRSLPVTTGLGFSFVFDEDLEMDVNYAMVLDNNPRDILYKLNLELRFGEIDDLAPDIDTSNFSEKGIIEGGIIE